MPPLRSSAAIRKRSSCTRTVTGCLTCRQRRVKCDGAAAPCANCRRLSIKCIPSFSSNFRTWATSSHDAPSSPTLQPPEAPIPHSLCAPDAPFEICAGTEKDPVGGGTVDGHPSAILSGEEWSMTTDGLEGPLCSTPSPCCASSVRVDGGELDMLCGIGLTTKNIQPLHNTIEEYDAILQMRNGLIEFPFVGCSGPDSAAGQHTTPPSSLSISDFRDRDRLAEHYNGHLIGFLSVKTTTWNFYSYILQKVQKGPDSTLKHGVLAWAESHRSWSRRPAAACPGPHYLKADACLRQLQEELTGLPTDMMSGYNVLDKLNSLLATSLFLSHCDVMYGDHESLISRLDSLKRYLTPRWHSLMEIATGVQLRVLIWLAYLDLRATLWTVPSASSQPTDYAPRDRVGDLFDLLRGSRTDDSVRQLKDSKYYLVECFGSIYPEQELRNDLSEEPWKLLSDDAMILFCDIKAFYGWCHQLTLARKPHGLYDELREAKIRALRSDIARIRAECNQIHSEELQAGHGFDYAARVQSHFLRCTCLHLSATILLNRINNPDVRTDSESQEAAREIIQITQQLKKAGDLRFPRSIAWPLPLFLAGIEVEDEVYQDWVLAFMEGLSEWGGSVMKATALLRQIVDKQAVEGVRISPWHAMMELGETIIV